jgi:phosphatidylglycerophosphate synthase
LKKDIFSIEQAAEKFNPAKDFFDVSAIWGKRPALKIVRWIYNTPITPPQVTIIALVFGIVAAFFLARQEYLYLCAGAILIQIKNILDTVDGHLARARNTPSRIGRFLDSIVDFTTNLAFYIAIGFHLESQNFPAGIWVLSSLAFLSSQLQCSYYVFYTVSYAHNVNKQTASRVDETVREEDNTVYSDPYKQKILMILQKLFLLLFGWQDRIMIKIDRWSLKYFDNSPSNWYLNKKILTMTSCLGLGMQLFFISLSSLLDQLYFYLWFIIVAGNFYWLFLIYYRMKGKTWKI